MENRGLEWLPNDVEFIPNLSLQCKKFVFLCLWNPSCERRLMPANASLCLHMQIMGFLWLLSSKNIFLLIKSYIFYFNTSQVNLTSDWSLNKSWALEFGHYWGTGARVIRVQNAVFTLVTWLLVLMAEMMTSIIELSAPVI